MSAQRSFTPYLDLEEQLHWLCMCCMASHINLRRACANVSLIINIDYYYLFISEKFQASKFVSFN